MAIKANLVIDQGATFSAIIDVVTTGGGVFNLGTYGHKAQMRKNYNSSTAIEITTDKVGDGSTGQLALSMSAANTTTIEPGRYLYDVVIISNSSGAVIRVVEGIVTVTPAMTRA